MWKTKTFWVGVSGILAGIGAGIAMITADPPQIAEGVQTIIGSLVVGSGMITTRLAIAKATPTPPEEEEDAKP